MQNKRAFRIKFGSDCKLKRFTCDYLRKYLYRTELCIDFRLVCIHCLTVGSRWLTLTLSEWRHVVTRRQPASHCQRNLRVVAVLSTASTPSNSPSLPSLTLQEPSPSYSIYWIKLWLIKTVRGFGF